MPELPEVETIVRALRDDMVSLAITSVVVSRRDIIHGDPRPLTRLLPGRHIFDVRRRAKRVIVELHPPVRLVFHLGMSGRLTLSQAASPVETHTHLRIAVGDDGLELRFRDPRRFGGVWCFAGGKRHRGRQLGELGPEPLDMSFRGFRRITRTRRQIKALLLDQRVIAGLGNICCDESLHAAGIHPQTRADTLGAGQTKSLLRAVKSTLRKAIRYKGSSMADYRQADGRTGSFQKHHRVYRRQGQPCHTCGTSIERLITAGRSTFFCPVCQGT
jgi:formamidopyrimidine-DNA glycosylase